MDKFYGFMISNTKWNLPIWFAGGVLAAVAIFRAFWNILHFFG
jgi:hypothetical protein